MPELHKTWTQLRWPSPANHIQNENIIKFPNHHNVLHLPSLKSFSIFRFICERNFVALDEVKKNAAKLAKNAWFDMDNIMATIIPKAAPDLLTDFLFSATTISMNGANIENNHLVGGITGDSTRETKNEHT